MSWQHCMQKKIEHEWGETVGKAIEGIHHHDLHALMEAILAIKSDLNAAAVLAKLTGWSFSCAFA